MRFGDGRERKGSRVIAIAGTQILISQGRRDCFSALDLAAVSFNNELAARYAGFVGCI